MMNFKLTLALFLSAITIGFAQITFENGYVILTDSKKINCQIKNIDWHNNPTKFEYRLSETETILVGDISTVQEFAIGNDLKFVRSKVNIDLCSDNLNNLDFESEPKFVSETLFLRVLVEGKSTLYQYKTPVFNKFFHASNGSIEQLFFKMYKREDNEILTNNMFKRQLLTTHKCIATDVNKINKLLYRKIDLVNFFIDQNKCATSVYKSFENGSSKKLFSLQSRLHLSSVSFTANNPVLRYRNITFDSKIIPAIGAEFEYLLPYNKNKWAIIVEPIFQKYNSEIVTAVEYDGMGSKLTAVADYSSFSIPIGLRHYFYLNNDSKIFVNGSYVLDFSLNSFIQFQRTDGVVIDKYEVRTNNIFALGAGYKIKNKYAIELRYITTRNLMKQYPLWTSGFNSISLIVGYSIF